MTRCWPLPMHITTCNWREAWRHGEPRVQSWSGLLIVTRTTNDIRILLVFNEATTLSITLAQSSFSFFQNLRLQCFHKLQQIAAKYWACSWDRFCNKEKIASMVELVTRKDLTPNISHLPHLHCKRTLKNNMCKIFMIRITTNTVRWTLDSFDMKTSTRWQTAPTHSPNKVIHFGRNF